jgi:hypothetical protein
MFPANKSARHVLQQTAKIDIAGVRLESNDSIECLHNAASTGPAIWAGWKPVRALAVADAAAPSVHESGVQLAFCRVLAS